MKTLLTVAITVVLLAIVAAVLFPFFATNHSRSPKRTSLSNLKQFAIAHWMYTEDHDGFGPSPDKWMDQLVPYTKNTMIFKVSSEVRKDDEFGYAYYRPLGGLRISAVENPAEVVFAFESSDMNWNANGGFELLPKKPYHDDGTTVFAFLDGHAKADKKTPKFEIVREYPTNIKTAEQVAYVLETCDAHSPFRDYTELPINRDTVGVLLKLAQVDEHTLVEGARMFLDKTVDNDRTFTDSVGREDLLELLKGLIVAYPDTDVHVHWNILINDNGKLRIDDEWPNVRMGLWLPRDFCNQLPEDLKKYGRRDISQFIKAHQEEE